MRKYPRLKGYDYGQYGPYFVTFCVKDRHELLGSIAATTVGHGSPTLQTHDHIIRNEAEFQRIWQYIDENPALWDEDAHHV